jgi:hypothetical protein
VSEKRFCPEWLRIQLYRALPQRIASNESPLRTADTTALQAYRANFARAWSANAGAQEPSVILYAYLATGQKVRDRCHHLCAAARTGTNCQDQITERKPSAGSDDLAKLAISFHMLAFSALSRSDARVHCEYVIHGCACSYSLFMHFGTDRSATLLFNFET